MLYKIGEKLGLIAFISELKYKIYKNKYFNQYNFSKEKISFRRSNEILNSKKMINDLIYKDENWNYIKNIHRMFMYRSIGTNLKFIDNICTNYKIEKLSKNKIALKSKGLRDDWIYYYLPSSIEGNYVFEFNSLIKTEFTEFQIAFRHKSIAERYRFRVIDNQKLVFETIHGGFFLNEIQSVPFSFELKENYNIKLLVKNCFYSFIVNDIVIMTIQDTAKLLGDGGIALIFWDDSLESKSNMDLIIENPHVYTIV
jgi:hypothetical protein